MGRRARWPKWHGHWGTPSNRSLRLRRSPPRGPRREKALARSWGTAASHCHIPPRPLRGYKVSLEGIDNLGCGSDVMALVTKYDAVREAQELLLDKCMQVRPRNPSIAH